ncbi:unnamed protein product [Schistosoma turkestanicum]|nr:unnamed protein product [Schistosoma turkestanicum]
MCNLPSNHQVTLDGSDTDITDSLSTNAEYEELKGLQALERRYHQREGDSMSVKSLRTVNYKSTSLCQPKLDHISSTCLSKKPNLSYKLSSTFIKTWESNKIALADANSLIKKLNRELTDCKLELETLRRQHKTQAVRLNKVVSREGGISKSLAGEQREMSVSVEINFHCWL